jgi:hypothetical protein
MGDVCRESMDSGALTPPLRSLGTGREAFVLSSLVSASWDVLDDESGVGSENQEPEALGSGGRVEDSSVIGPVLSPSTHQDVDGSCLRARLNGKKRLAEVGGRGAEEFSSWNGEGLLLSSGRSLLLASDLTSPESCDVLCLIDERRREVNSRKSAVLALVPRRMDGWRRRLDPVIVVALGHGTV